MPEPTTQNPSRVRNAALAVVLVCAVASGVTALLWRNPNATKETPKADVEPAVEQFFVGVAALDIDENQRAAEIFGQLSQKLPDEPAVWANLAISRLRLNELDAAEDAVLKAAEIVPGNSEIVFLRAVLDERGGRLDEAVKRLSEVSNPDAMTLYTLSEWLKRIGRPESERQRLEALNRLIELDPGNLVAQFERGRLAARLEDAAELSDSLQQLSVGQEEWNPQARELLQAARAAAERKDFRDAATQLTFLQNVSKPLEAYQQAVASLGASRQSAGRPIRVFLKREMPRIAVADSDRGLRFEIDPGMKTAVRPDLFLAFALSGRRDSTLLTLTGNELRFGQTAVLHFPGVPESLPSRHSILCIDVNNDFREDLVCVGAGGISLYLRDSEGQFNVFEPSERETPLFTVAGDATWAIDYEADGDLDLLVAHGTQPPRLLRNNGDMTFAEVDAFPNLPSPKDLLWLDFDRDGDGDLVILDRAGQVLAAMNQRSGKYDDPEKLPIETTAVAIAAGDVDQDGSFEVVVLDEAGHVHQFGIPFGGKRWDGKELLRWREPPDLKSASKANRVSLWLVDLDNNGGIDVAASADTSTFIWLNGLGAKFQSVTEVPPLFVTAVTDVNGDGRLDLVGMTPEAGVAALNRGTKDYRWQSILTQANPNAGDNRINSFGLGGRIEIRAGLLVQSTPITSARTHFGLGEHERTGVARIVWPNGTMQAEFDLAADESLTAQQRLKGSCPFVFARRGDELVFIKDFIWRSPLGLKINSQETAGVSQTEDRIKIPGELLTPQDGHYEIRITADLWETHFFDHVSLLVVDHPESADVYIDERFVPAQPPDLSVQTVAPPRPVRNARDEAGRSVDEMVCAVDGEYLDTFPLGKYQGVAQDHWLEFELDADIPRNQPFLLIGQGWVYPTDSSINVALSQGHTQRPHDLCLDVLGANGEWHPVAENLGFPAGKNKAVLLCVPTDVLAAGLRRFRLRTNLEIYWDYLGWTVAEPSPETKQVHVETISAELRHRGFSAMSPPDRRKPDLPDYGRLAGTAPRWLDLEGYYTRYGDVGELLHAVDDRYVIMNAGDEIVMTFAALPPPSKGWTRDFVLIGDGWVKDGDFNTSFSRIVHPLPSHAVPAPVTTTQSFFDDPVYRAHQADWRDFHTRYVTPQRFQRGFFPPSPRKHGDSQ